MDRDTFVRILDRAPGLEGSAERYEVGKEHRLTLYLGEPGRAMQVDEVTSCELLEGFVQVVTREQETLFLPYEAVHGVVVRPRGKAGAGRPGFA